jgi:glycosyltransferase involved in cell wall biosynthesis
MPKIVFIITKGDNIGGAQIYVLELAKQFKRKGYFVEFIVGTTGYLTQELQTQNIKFTHIGELSNTFNPFTNLISIIKIAAYLKRVKPNLVSLNSSKAGLIGRIACFFTKTPTIFTVHGWSFTDGINSKKQLVFSFFERLVKNLSSAWIVVSKFDYTLGIKYGACRPNDTYIIHNGVEVNTVENLKDKTLTNELSIVVTARHDKQKDYLTLFTALQQVSNVKVYLLGDGPMFEDNKILAKKLNILDKLVFVGFTSNVQDYLSKADIFLLITNWEGFPISILEAMNNRLPIIATDICGISEAVLDGITGFLVKPKSANMLADKINLLVDDFHLREKMGNSGYLFLQNNFSFEIMFQKTEIVFNKYMKI